MLTGQRAPSREREQLGDAERRLAGATRRQERRHKFAAKRCSKQPGSRRDRVEIVTYINDNGSPGRRGGAACYSLVVGTEEFRGIHYAASRCQPFCLAR